MGLEECNGLIGPVFGKAPRRSKAREAGADNHPVGPFATLKRRKW
jgi:hypothetical protein